MSDIESFTKALQDHAALDAEHFKSQSTQRDEMEVRIAKKIDDNFEAHTLILVDIRKETKATNGKVAEATIQIATMKGWQLGVSIVGTLFATGLGWIFLQVVNIPQQTAAAVNAAFEAHSK